MHRATTRAKTSRYENVKNVTFPRFRALLLLTSKKYCTCHEKSRSSHPRPAPATRNHRQVENENCRQFYETRVFELQQHRPRCRFTAPATKMHHFRHASNDPRLPTFREGLRNATPATRIKKCPMYCTCHAKRGSRAPKVENMLRLPPEMEAGRNRHEYQAKRRCSETRSPGTNGAQARSKFWTLRAVSSCKGHGICRTRR